TVDLPGLVVVRGRTVYLDGDVGYRDPDAPQLAVTRVVGRGDRARLGEAVALVDHDAERVDEGRDVWAERGAPADGVLEPATEALAHGGGDQAIGEGEHQLVERPDGFPAPLALRRLDAVLEDPLHDPAPRRHLGPPPPSPP